MLNEPWWSSNFEACLKQLFIAKMVEKCGAKVRRPNEIKKGDGTRLRAGVETVDELTGDWTLETSRQKLHEFLAKRKIALEYIMEEIGAASSRTYVAKLDFEVDGKHYKGTFHFGSNLLVPEKNEMSQRFQTWF